MSLNQATPMGISGRISPEHGICFDGAYSAVNSIVPDLIKAKAGIDGDTLGHELGVGQLAADMIPFDFAASSASSYFGGKKDWWEVAAVCGALHDTGKYRADIQGQLRREDDFGPEVRQWVRDEHCLEGVLRLFTYEKSGLVPPEQLSVLAVARFVAGHHHSRIPEGYADMPREQSIPWGLTHLVKYADVLHALKYDGSQRRRYQKQRDGLTQVRPPEVVLRIIRQEVGEDDPVIDGVEIDIWPEIERRLRAAGTTESTRERVTV